MATPELRFTFIKSAMKFLRDHSFDGIDFDWVSSNLTNTRTLLFSFLNFEQTKLSLSSFSQEYPAFREGSTPEDKEGYAKLIRVSVTSVITNGRNCRWACLLPLSLLPSLTSQLCVNCRRPLMTDNCNRRQCIVSPQSMTTRHATSSLLLNTDDKLISRQTYYPLHLIE